MRGAVENGENGTAASDGGRLDFLFGAQACHRAFGSTVMMLRGWQGVHQRVCEYVCMVFGEKGGFLNA